MPVIIDATGKLRCRPREEAQTSMQPTGDALSWSTKPHLGDGVRKNLLLQNELGWEVFLHLKSDTEEPAVAVSDRWGP
jgi:hypothetical protein